MKTRRGLLWLIVPWAACSDGSGGTVATLRQLPIVGGTLDRADPAVGAVLIENNSGQIRAICTGTLISPRVVMTAAHCVSINDPELGPVAPKQVFFGTQLKEPGAIGTFDVLRTTFHPTFNERNLEQGGDIALLLLDEAPPITPAPINRQKLEGRAGEMARLVGFGITSGGGQDDGTKREVESRLDDVQPKLLWFFESGRNTCNGDSGGPTFFDVGGKEVVVGVTSFGDENCEVEGANTRVDVYATAWIDPWVKANDPSATTTHEDPPGPTVDPADPSDPTDPPGVDDDDEALLDPAVAGGCSVGLTTRGAGAGGILVLIALVGLLVRRPRSRFPKFMSR